MEKYITVDGKKLRMVANARVPRIYRNLFNSDLILDMQKLTEGYKAGAQGETLPIEVLTIFENVAWVFLKEGGEEVGNNPDEWLETIEGMFSIYEVLPQIIQLWKLNNKTTSNPPRTNKGNHKRT